jgi:multiple sugar transport system substrate-binding protein
MDETGNEMNRTRRTVLKGVGTAGAVGLAGCIGGGSNTAGSSQDNGQTTFKFWTGQSETDRQQVIKDLIRNYEGSNPANVKMVVVTENELPTQVPAARASNTLPTVAEFGLSSMHKLGSAGILSKDAAKAVIENLGRAKFYDGALKLAQAPKGGHYGIPMTGWVEGFWYRRPVLEEHGLDEPTSWDTLLEAAKTLHKPEKNQYGIVVGTKKEAYTRQCFTPFALSNDAHVFNAKGEIVFDSKEMIEALDYYAKLAQYTPPGADTWKTANHTYLNEQCHLIEYSTYIMSDIAEQSTEMVENTGFASYVEKKTRSSFGQIVGLNLFSTATQSELQAGKDFSTFLMTDEHYIKYLHMAPGGMFPVLKPVAQSQKWQNHPVLKAWGDTLVDISSAFATVDRFGYINGKVIPTLGKLTSQYLIAEAVSRVTSGEDPATVASQVAEKMRETIQE